MPKVSPSLRHAPTLRAQLLERVPIAPDPAGARALARYLRRGGEATPSGAPVIRPLATVGATVAFRCPYCAAIHTDTVAALPFRTVACGQRRAIYLASALNHWAIEHLPKWWRGRLGRTHGRRQRDRLLAAEAALLEQLERIPPTACPPAPWTIAPRRPTLSLIRGGLTPRGIARSGRGGAA